ncbi:hypothetical protein D3C87_1923000 [compost metagenome]
MSVSWSIGKTSSEDALILKWQERDGPIIRGTVGKGFGSKLIKLGLTGTGGVEVEYDANGLTVTMQALVSQLRQS